MSLSLYLDVLDSAGTPVPGSATVDRLSNPLRGNRAVAKPFDVLTYSFGADAPMSDAGGGVGKVDVGELVVDMTDDAAAAVLFKYIALGKRFRSIDVLARVNGERPAVVAAAGVSSAQLSGLSWSVSGDGSVRRLRVDGVVFSVGSTTQRPDGTYNPFTFTSYDVSRGVLT
ncbi:hypothetical protein ACXR2U_06140 [Jatrophihabitans sp. YIM 134969]